MGTSDMQSGRDQVMLSVWVKEKCDYFLTAGREKEK